MRITIIGWYGTETIGDRAILAGLLSFFNKSYSNFEIRLGSLHPFFSERSINEDHAFYKEIIGKAIKIDVFDSKDSKALSKAIESSDLLAMGGGPLMDLNELFMVEYAFKKARKAGVKTALLGCGIGPLFHKKFRKAVLNITVHSDIIILRDSHSKESLENIYLEFNNSLDSTLIDISPDPAVEAALAFNKNSSRERQEYIAVNLRAFPLEYTKEKGTKDIDEELRLFVESLAEKFSDREIRLIPMHYFHVGGDDRVFLNSIALHLKKENITVQNANLTLKETMEVYRDAYLNIGMRFHSVVLQTILSGDNYVLDYTEPRKGKIFGFLQDMDKDGLYDERYICLQEDAISTEMIQESDERFTFDKDEVERSLSVYVDRLKEIRR